MDMFSKSIYDLWILAFSEELRIVLGINGVKRPRNPNNKLSLNFDSAESVIKTNLIFLQFQLQDNLSLHHLC